MVKQYFFTADCFTTKLTNNFNKNQKLLQQKNIVVKQQLFLQRVALQQTSSYTTFIVLQIIVQ